MKRAPRQVPYAITERADELLVATYLEWRYARGAALQSGSRFLGLTSLPVWRQDVLTEQTYARMVAIVESYVDLLIELLFERRVPRDNRIVVELVEDRIDQSSFGWERRKEVLRMLDVNLAQFSRWGQVDAAVDVRNAIAHGVGSITRRQREDKAIVQKLSSIGVHVDGGRVQVGSTHLQHLFALAREFVKWLNETSSGVADG